MLVQTTLNYYKLSTRILPSGGTSMDSYTKLIQAPMTIWIRKSSQSSSLQSLRYLWPWMAFQTRNTISSFTLLLTTPNCLQPESFAINIQPLRRQCLCFLKPFEITGLIWQRGSFPWRKWWEYPASRTTSGGNSWSYRKQNQLLCMRPIRRKWALICPHCHSSTSRKSKLKDDIYSPCPTYSESRRARRVIYFAVCTVIYEFVLMSRIFCSVEICKLIK